MKSILVIFLATIVTLQLLEAHQQPKVLVYEVSERDGEDPEIQLLKVEDVNMDDDQTLNKFQQYKSHNNHKHRNRHTSNRQSVHYADQYQIEKYKDNNRHKLHSKNNHFTSYKKLNSNYRNNKNKNSYRNRDVENIFIDWDRQQNYKDEQDQIRDYIKRKLQENDKKSVRNSQKKQKNPYDDDYVDIGEERGNAEQDVLLSQLLRPLKRQKREAERSSIIQRLKQLLKRLQELDDDGEARLNGKAYVSKQSDANNWNLDSSSDLVDNTYKKHSIQINRSPSLRSGIPLEDEDATNLAEDEKFFSAVLGEDRTMPPPPRYKYDDPDY